MPIFNKSHSTRSAIVAFVMLALLVLTGCNPAAVISGSTTTAKGQANSTANNSATTAVNAAQARLISPADAKAMLAANPKVVLLDVRTSEEYASGHITGSRLLPYDEIAARASELPADRQTPIIVYCRSGRRSAIAAAELLKLGYVEVYDLGGIQDWPYGTVTG